MFSAAVRQFSFAIAALGFLIAPTGAIARFNNTPAAVVRTVISMPKKQVEYARAKLALDQIIDPSIDAALIEAEISGLVAVARAFAGVRASDGAKIDAVRKVLYEAGSWNDNRPFTYDQSDPLGQNLTNKLLSTYLRTRRGNCVTMPILFMIVGRGIGLNLTLTTAPLHILVRYTRSGIHPFNIEATSGGNFARDEWYRQNWPMSDRAIESGLYLRTHTDPETAAVMATTVLDYLISVGRNAEALAVADEILAANPLDGYTMVKKGSAIAAMLQTEFFDRYSTPNSIPSNMRPRYAALASDNAKAFADAETLGWEPTELSK